MAGAARPRPVGPSRWDFPDPSQAGPEGFLGVGADLEPETLVHAYRHGVFPWPHPPGPVPWFSPDPRGVLWPGGLVVRRSLAKRLRNAGWEASLDTAFADVTAACAVRPGESTWITADMRAAYLRLHRAGWAHSVEVWSGDRLAGGLYGVQNGAVFTGESMFHRESDASKAALVVLADRFFGAGGALIDVQMRTPHLARLGIVDVSRAHFLDVLARHRDRHVAMDDRRRPVAEVSAAEPPSVPGDGPSAMTATRSRPSPSTPD
jgi:leucyl/phenylalanyl-tRNA--protein transferase